MCASDSLQLWQCLSLRFLYCIRFCTILHAVLRANREAGTAHSLARRLVVIADNCSENRNYTTCMKWASEVVAAGWFDSVQFLFGPVGHTHNGVDAIHGVHNSELLKQEAAYLGGLIHNFTATWYGVFLLSLHIARTCVRGCVTFVCSLNNQDSFHEAETLRAGYTAQ